MSEPTQSNTKAVTSGCPPVPQSIMTASRDELDHVQLEIFEGHLPDDVQGHVFIVAPVGSVDSGGLPFKDGNSFLNGDGMIYRLDFDRPGKVSLKSRIVKPLDYWIDEATKKGTQFEKLGFGNHGIVRLSYFLGMRNELNTAFVPMQLSGELERLIVTYDAGRPYILDTETLEVVTPVGSNKEWQGALKLPYPFNFLFKPIFSTAHPVFDFYKSEMFVVNYGRSLDNLLESSPLIDIIVDLCPDFRQKLENFKALQDFVYLIRWDGSGKLERWNLVLPDGSPLRIEQTMHQIGISEDYVVLMDTAFSTGLEQLLANPIPDRADLETLLREFFEKPPAPDASIYIVNRQDLKNGQLPESDSQDVKVVVRKVVIPREAAHFLVDYENPDDKITLHISHMCAWDAAEWLRRYDKSAYDPQTPAPLNLNGMEQNPMDVSCMGRYVIDGKSMQEAPVESKLISDQRYTWGAGLYAYLDRLPSGMIPRKLENIYWTTFGLWEELMTEYLFEVFKNYKYRQVSPSDLLALGKSGKPACLFRLDTISMEIADCYECPPGSLVSSPQFMPCQGGAGSSTKGYIVCTAFIEKRQEIWMFDAEDLKKGPICKFRHPDLSFAFTLHTAWLPRIGRYEGKYKISWWEDYFDLVSSYPYDSHPPETAQQLQELFKKELYERFEQEKLQST